MSNAENFRDKMIKGAGVILSEDYLCLDECMDTRCKTKTNTGLTLTKGMSDENIHEVMLDKLRQVRGALGLDYIEEDDENELKDRVTGFL